jgi:hypothetical protein
MDYYFSRFYTPKLKRRRAAVLEQSGFEQNLSD